MGHGAAKAFAIRSRLLDDLPAGKDGADGVRVPALSPSCRWNTSTSKVSVMAVSEAPVARSAAIRAAVSSANRGIIMKGSAGATYPLRELLVVLQRVRVDGVVGLAVFNCAP